MNEVENPRAAQKLAGRLLLAVFLANGVLVSTHLGEFWPFSIYPMFSRANTELHNVVVRELSEEEAAQGSFVDRPADQLYGEPFGVKKHGVDPVDLAKYVRLTDEWDADRIRGIVRMFAPGIEDEELIIIEVRGDIASDENAALVASPTIVFNRESGRYVGSEAAAEVPQ